MLGALLSELVNIHTHPFPDDLMLEEANDDQHWASDDNRFDDWLLHPDADEPINTEPFY